RSQTSKWHAISRRSCERLVSRWKLCTTKEAGTMTFSVARRSTATSYSGCRRSCCAIFATDSYHADYQTNRHDVSDKIEIEPLVEIATDQGSLTMQANKAKEMEAACHCGTVRFRVKLPHGFNTARRCTCSYCRMRGAVAVSADVGGITFDTGE